MSHSPDPLGGIDRALMLMRHLWAPQTAGRPAAGAAPGIDVSTVLVVHAVHDAAAEGTPPTVADVASRLGVAPATASRLCDRAVAADAIAKAPAPGDARRVRLTLTGAGAQLHAHAREFRLDYLARITAQWSPDDVARFASLLARFADAVHAEPPTAPTPRSEEN